VHADATRKETEKRGDKKIHDAAQLKSEMQEELYARIRVKFSPSSAGRRQHAYRTAVQWPT
jgi:hypothetical protein